MAKRKGSSAPSCSRARKKVDREAREVENAKRMDKLPPEMWAKILDELKSDDLFPLALSCRYFRQKQKELVARTGQKKAKSGKSPLALKTNLYRKLKEGQPVSADYLRFCSKEKVSRGVGRQKAARIRYLAAYHGHLPLLQELLKPLKTFAPEFSEAAALGGQLETLKWLKSEGYRWEEYACRVAAQGGHLEVLKWLRSEGCPWNEWTCAYAAERGDLEMLKWLRSEGCPWDKWTTFDAAMKGHLDVLQWAIDNGCPYTVNYNTRPALQSLGLA